MEENKSELIAEIAELKLQLLSYSRLFTLTAEEVEIVEYLFTNYLLRSLHFDENKLTKRERNLLTRIKQWQDEQKNNNHG